MKRLFRAIFVVALTAFLQSCAPGRSRGPLPPEPGANPDGVFQSPIQGFELLSRFGPRGRRYHTGIDIRGKRGGGDPVAASKAGRVIRAQTMSGYGRIVEILHGDGFTTRYAHLRRINVRKGQRVESGETIGTVGATGRASTAHLHFEILTPGYRFMDPWPYIKHGKR